MSNVLLASLIIYLIWGKSTKVLFMGVFFYTTFHFLYSVSALGSYTDLLVMHEVGADVLVKSTGIVFMISVFLQLNRHYSRQVFNDKKMGIFFCTIISLLVTGFFINTQTTDLQFQNMLSIVGMIMLLWLLSVGFQVDLTQLKVEPQHLIILNVIIAFALLIAFIEVFYNLSWARYWYQDKILFRASSFLFNPNLFGMWCAMLYLGLSFLFHLDDSLSKRTILFGLFLLSASLYLSGSRSFIYLLILMLILLLPLIKGKTITQLLSPLALLLSTFFAISHLAGTIGPHSSKPDVSSGWQSVELVGERIIAAPIGVLQYGLFRINEKNEVNEDIAKAIDGRFQGSDPDSGILKLYDDMGWIGLLAIIGLGLMFLIWASQVYLIRRDVSSSYSLVMLLFCGGAGISIGYQVFPVWVFIAIALSPCLALWRHYLINLDKQSKTDALSITKS